MKKTSAIALVLLITFCLDAGVCRAGALHDAILQDNTPKVLELIRQGEDVNVPLASLGGTPLMLAIDQDNLEAVSALVAAGADVNAADQTGKTVLMYAALAEEPVYAELLLANGAQPDAVQNEEGLSALHHAAAYGNPSVLAAILAGGAKADATDHSGSTPLMAAVKKGNAESVKLLLFNGASPLIRDYYGTTPLWMAVNHGWNEIAEALARAEEDGWMSKEAAPRAAEPESDLILASGQIAGDAGIYSVDYRNNDGWTPLMIAALDGRVELASLLLDKRARVNAMTPDGFTPLMLAVQQGHHAMAMLLLKGGADPDIVNASSGQSALMAASWAGDLQMTEILLKQGADPHLKNKQGFGYAGNSPKIHTAQVPFTIESLRALNRAYRYSGFVPEPGRTAPEFPAPDGFTWIVRWSPNYQKSYNKNLTYPRPDLHPERFSSYREAEQFLESVYQYCKPARNAFPSHADLGFIERLD